MNAVLPTLRWFAGFFAVFGSFASAIGQSLEPNDPINVRPVVIRAGKLPKGLPPWFEILDTDKDGQVALYEWRKSGKSLDEFEWFDLNNDGFLTPEEVLRIVLRIRPAPDDPLAEVGRKIDEIIYSDLTPDQMLAKLKPFIAIHDKRTAVEKKTGFTISPWGRGKHTGPANVIATGLPFCGLHIVMVNDEVRMIRRLAGFGDKQYPAMTICWEFKESDGYFRIYND